MPLSAMVVDDEPLALDLIRLLADEIDGLKVVATARDGEAALAAASKHKPDVVLLDISMPGLDGMALARRLVAEPTPPAIIFCTAFEHFAVEAFDIAAIDYLLKPITATALDRAVRRAKERRTAPAPAELQAFWLPHLGELVRITADDIDWIEAEGDYVRLRVGTASFLLLASLKELERRLDRTIFIRLRRSAIVRREFVAGLIHEGSGVWSARLRSGERVRIGRRYQGALRELRQTPGVRANG